MIFFHHIVSRKEFSLESNSMAGCDFFLKKYFLKIRWKNAVEAFKLFSWLPDLSPLSCGQHSSIRWDWEGVFIDASSSVKLYRDLWVAENLSSALHKFFV